MPDLVFRCRTCRTEHSCWACAAACEAQGDTFRFKENGHARMMLSGVEVRVIITARWIEGSRHHRAYHFRVYQSLNNPPELIGSVGKVYEGDLQAL